MTCSPGHPDSVGKRSLEELRRRLRPDLQALERMLAALREFCGQGPALSEPPTPCPAGPTRGICEQKADSPGAEANASYGGTRSGATSMDVSLKGIAVHRGRLEPAASHEWLSVANAARTAKVHRGTIARLANAGVLTDNGREGRERRVLKASVLRWMGERVENQRKRAFADFERDIERIPERH